MTAALSVAGHLLILLALLSTHGDAPEPEPPAPATVELVAAAPVFQPLAPTAPSPPTPAPVKPAAAKPAATKPKPIAKSSPAKAKARAVARTAATVLAAGDDGPEDTSDQVSDGQLAGAATAGSGLSGGACNMVGRLQAALRKDRRVQAAVAEARHADGPGGGAMMVWNGGWVRSHGQDGAGLAAVREAIMWEIAFSPEPCRAEPVRGLVLLSMNDGPGAAKLVVGSGRWRWSDLLGAKSGVRIEGSERP